MGGGATQGGGVSQEALQAFKQQEAANPGVNFASYGQMAPWGADMQALSGVSSLNQWKPGSGFNYAEKNFTPVVTQTSSGGGGGGSVPAITTVPEFNAEGGNDSVNQFGMPTPYAGVDAFDAEGDDNFLTQDEIAAYEDTIAKAAGLDSYDSTTDVLYGTPGQGDEVLLTNPDGTQVKGYSMGSEAGQAQDAIYNNNQQIFGTPTGNNVTSLVTGGLTNADGGALSNASGTANKVASAVTGVTDAIKEIPLVGGLLTSAVPGLGTVAKVAEAVEDSTSPSSGDPFVDAVANQTANLAKAAGSTKKDDGSYNTVFNQSSNTSLAKGTPAAAVTEAEKTNLAKNTNLVQQAIDAGATIQDGVYKYADGTQVDFSDIRAPIPEPTPEPTSPLTTDDRGIIGTGSNDVTDRTYAAQKAKQAAAAADAKAAAEAQASINTGTQAATGNYIVNGPHGQQVFKGADAATKAANYARAFGTTAIPETKATYTVNKTTDAYSQGASVAKSGGHLGQATKAASDNAAKAVADKGGSAADQKAASKAASIAAAIAYQQNKDTSSEDRQAEIHYANTNADNILKAQTTKLDASGIRNKKEAEAFAKEHGLGYSEDDGVGGLQRAVTEINAKAELASSQETLDAAKAAAKSKDAAKAKLKELGFPAADRDNAPDILRQHIRAVEAAESTGKITIPSVAVPAPQEAPPKPVAQAQPAPTPAPTPIQAFTPAPATRAATPEEKAAGQALASSFIDDSYTPDPKLPKQKGTVICTALYDLGEIDKRTHTLAERWAVTRTTAASYYGYLHWATPVADGIREGRYGIFKYLGKFWADQMAYEMTKGREGKQTIKGWLCCRVGLIVSKLVGMTCLKEELKDV